MQQHLILHKPDFKTFHTNQGSIGQALFLTKIVSNPRKGVAICSRIHSSYKA